MGPRIKSIKDVAEKQLCCGCGACAYIDPETIRMVDVMDQGRRPVVSEAGADPARGDEALRVCPGIELTHEFDRKGQEWIPDLVDGWGPVLEVWEGYAADASVRYAGSSGGAATALALHCLQAQGMHGVLHVAARSETPYLNQTVLSRSREELLSATGSRYAPASPCDGLQTVEDAPGACVFIGKPCDVAAVAKARRLRPALDRNLGLTIAFFCAGTPSTQGTLEMIRKMGVDNLAEVDHVRYRGNGWPGMAEVKVTIGGQRQTRQLTYDESWNQILQKHRQWRCHVCADHTGEFADVAVGDPWYRPITPGDPGRSLILVRTERGRDVVRAALARGDLIAERVGPELLPASQMNLLRARGAVWGRVLTCRMMGVAAPRFRNIPTFAVWWHHLTPGQKAQSIYGTVKRVFVKGLYKRTAGTSYHPPQRSQALPTDDARCPTTLPS
ncbi:MAG: Coenzyme F420 hydrogenase/dehydrogenase, beta subunit C-terminal domain [Actinobacteria bacterium]|nr:Coenzyme F420 hydrogenase/dehydrogenase, beta subunit C-terminal domain [Actinomycetota bacterium]